MPETNRVLYERSFTAGWRMRRATPAHEPIIRPADLDEHAFGLGAGAAIDAREQGRPIDWPDQPFLGETPTRIRDAIRKERLQLETVHVPRSSVPNYVLPEPARA